MIALTAFLRVKDLQAERYMLCQLRIYYATCIKAYFAISCIIVAIYLCEICANNCAAIKDPGLLHVQSVGFIVIILCLCNTRKYS